MRELNQTAFMHNRIRMICASTGCDAQPYFRVFNPLIQAKKFDPEGVYIKRYIPELKDVPRCFIHEPINQINSYPEPIVNHKLQVQLALKMFRDIKMD